MKTYESNVESTKEKNKRLEREKEEQRQQTANTAYSLSVIAFIICLFLCGFLIISAISNKNALDKKYQANKEKIEELQKEWDSIQNIVEKEGDDGVTYSAYDSGRAVADAQNGIADLNYDDGDPDGKTKKEYDKQMDSMKKYVTSDEAKRWYYGLPNYKWTFDTFYNYGTANIPVIWTCYNNSKLCAYAVGEFDSNQGKFTGISVYTTEYGFNNSKSD